MSIKNFLPSKSRRGLSSIVGALLFVVLMVSAFAALGVALDSQSNIASTGRDVAAKDLEKIQEDFTLTNIEQAPGGNLKIELTNNGQNTAEMFTVVMTNKTDSGEPTTTIDVPSETSYLPVGAKTPTDIVKTLNLKMNIPPLGKTEDYDFKVISSLGTIKKLSIQCDGDSQICGIVVPPVPPGTPSLSATLFLDGPAGVNTKVSTVIMYVQNTGSVPLEDVYPVQVPCSTPVFPSTTEAANPTAITADFTDCIFTPLTDNTCGSAPPPPPNNNDGNGICLEPGQMAIFKWDGTVRGDVGDKLSFCNQAQGEDYDGNLVGPTSVTCDSLEIINPNDCGTAECKPSSGGESVILIDDLLIRPSLFLVIPSPFGDTQDNADQTGLWGVNVANPTIKNMTVSKVTLVVYPPGGNSQDTVFQAAGGPPQHTNYCNAEDIEPNKGTQPQGYWSCPRDNILMWQSFSDPVIVPANTTKSFLVRAEPYQIKASGDNLDALIIQANVYTDFGSFGKSGYQSSMYELPAPIINVYLDDESNINDRSQFISAINDITENSTKTFNVVLADMDNVTSTVINTNSKLIINVPREWTFDKLNDYVGFVDPPTVTLHSDGSTQIVGITNSVIGDGTNDARRISFDATAPDVNSERLFVMYILADGTVTNASGDLKTIGPLNEAVLNVDP